ncbi:MAG: PEP/pyruvate-binding domain-containing protein, partial [Candidatus Methylomirabilales bacterium]
MAKTYVYFFGEGKAEGKAVLKDLLGGKGANLAEMTALGIPVPPGFTITTEACVEFMRRNATFPPGLWEQVGRNLARLEEAFGATFGDPKNPLLVSVRSGARVSMPGMMDTVLNLGLNDRTMQGLIARSGNPRFAYDSYRRFVQMFGDVVLGLRPESQEERDPFEVTLEQKKREEGVAQDTDLSADALRDLVRRFKALIRQRKGVPFPDDPQEQLRLAVSAVFDSWKNPRAVKYRELHRISANWGTAVNVQAMVFGNSGDRSGTGVGFTRDPSTGENTFYGEFLINAQGEDVVAGVRTPQPISKLKDTLPKAYEQLHTITKRLEKHYRDIQDFEFTVEDEKLYMLQTRSGKRTGHAAVRIAV